MSGYYLLAILPEDFDQLHFDEKEAFGSSNITLFFSIVFILTVPPA